MLSHKEVLEYIWEHKEVLGNILGLPDIWIRGKEFIIDKQTNEKADLVFQDIFNMNSGSPPATLFVLELKKETGDHEILGQLKKYVGEMDKMTKYGQWNKVEGIAVAHEYTKSGKKLLWDEGFRTFTYHTNAEGNIYLREDKKIIRKAVVAA